MNNTISSDLQSRLLSLSSLVHEDKRSLEDKSSKVEEIGNTILEKIYAENSNLPTSARLYLEQIASSIIDDKWSDIPKPIEMKFDFQKLKGVADALALASMSTTIDLFELFRFMMKQKSDEAYNLATISIMDTKLSLQLDKARFEKQEKANQMELGAGIAAGALQCIQGAAQAGSNLVSIGRTAKLGLETKNAINLNKETADAKITLDSDLKTQNAVTSKYNKLDSEITVMKAKNDPKDAAALADLKVTKNDLDTDFVQANNKVDKSARKYNELSAKFEEDSKLIDQKTNIERFNDQFRSNVINAVKGAFDVGVSFVRFGASNEKLEADMLEATKNTTDRSANAMSDAGRKASESVKEMARSFDGILQSLSSTTTNSLRA